MTLTLRLSLSARRAWIEIVVFHLFASSGVVALRKESVDRNYIIKITETGGLRSLSARRAWIEILLVYLALIRYLSRSPQGERG